jgi:predicted MFS family arabinose efflux permease
MPAFHERQQPRSTNAYSYIAEIMIHFFVMNVSSKLIPLALGAFAIGTESYVVAGVLPTIASDLGITVPVAGQLITAFALTYALGSPLLAVVTGTLERRRLLLASLGAFAFFNLLAATSHSYAMLFVARIGMGLSAGAFMPAATAYAVATTATEQRGRALATIYGGLTVSMIIGVPLGVIVGEHLGWRSIFVGVAALALAAFAGVALTLKVLRPSTVVSLAERIAIARRPEVLRTLFVTVIMMMGVYTLYAYLAPFLKETSHLVGSGVAVVFLLFGLGSTAGNFLSGSATDRVGPYRVLTTALTVLIGLFLTLSLVATIVPPEFARWLIVPLIAVWGFAGYAFLPAQQTHMVSLEPKLAPITLSLNASAIYLGAAMGAVVGSAVIAHGSVHHLGWFAAVFEIGALVLIRFAPARRASRLLWSAAA